MKVSSYKAGPSTVICPREAITQAECDQLKLMIAEATLGGATAVVLDLSEVPFIDSRGLEMLLDLERGCREQGGRLKLAGLSDNCAEILRLTDLYPRFEVMTSVEQGARGLA
jgi:anti-sigma B factor antagonist